jgi:hypothetical protein
VMVSEHDASPRDTEKTEKNAEREFEFPGGAPRSPDSEVLQQEQVIVRLESPT